ncbi:MAG: hypothetical protein IT440_07430 [Phycisphaeraceae bacterium]|nr:hypothetical protein [Phycisphaeraceae bacterium]
MAVAIDSSNGVWARSWRMGIGAAKANVLPATALWFVGLAAVLGYYMVPSMRQVMEQVATLKIHWGLWYALVAQAVVGGVVPLAIRVIQNRGRLDFSLGYFLFFVAFWGVKGVEVDLLYRGQALLFGDNNHVLTLACKTIADQFVYAPIWGLPSILLPYIWADAGFSWTTFRRRMHGPWYRREVLPVLILDFVVWVPAVILIYCLPLALQLPLQNVIMCIWVLVMMFVARPEEGATSCVAA